MENLRQVADASDTRPILVVDDDDGIRQLICAVLERQGYAVVSAANGMEALRVAKAHDINLVVTDIIMPRMNGPELVFRLRSERPEIKVLFITGYPGDAALNETCCSLAFISKPFRITDLITVIQRLL